MRGCMSDTIEIVLICIAGALIFTAMVLLFRYKRKIPPVGKTRFGFFIERDYDHPFDMENSKTKEWPHHPQ
jgi:hypothetical protein